MMLRTTTTLYVNKGQIGVNCGEYLISIWICANVVTNQINLCPLKMAIPKTGALLRLLAEMEREKLSLLMRKRRVAERQGWLH